MATSPDKAISPGAPAEATSVPLAKPTLARIDAWIARQPDPKPARAAAVAQLVDIALGSQGLGAEAIPLEQLNASNDE